MYICIYLYIAKEAFIELSFINLLLLLSNVSEFFIFFSSGSLSLIRIKKNSEILLNKYNKCFFSYLYTLTFTAKSFNVYITKCKKETKVAGTQSFI